MIQYVTLDSAIEAISHVAQYNGAGREEDAVAMLVDSGQSSAAEIRELEHLVANLKMEARCNAMEAKTANATIAEIYQVITRKTGEPGNWNGARPIELSALVMTLVKLEFDKEPK